MCDGLLCSDPFVRSGWRLEESRIRDPDTSPQQLWLGLGLTQRQLSSKVIRICESTSSIYVNPFQLHQSWHMEHTKYYA